MTQEASRQTTIIGERRIPRSQRVTYSQELGLRAGSEKDTARVRNWAKRFEELARELELALDVRD